MSYIVDTIEDTTKLKLAKEIAVLAGLNDQAFRKWDCTLIGSVRYINLDKLPTQYHKAYHKATDLGDMIQLSYLANQLGILYQTLQIRIQAKDSSFDLVDVGGYYYYVKVPKPLLDLLNNDKLEVYAVLSGDLATLHLCNIGKYKSIMIDGYTYLYY